MDSGESAVKTASIVHPENKAFCDCPVAVECRSLDQRRNILHVDMDAFFAAVEQMDQPALRGRPVLVGHAGPRGVVAAASYEARAFGCHSAQPMSVALRNCPAAVVLPGRFHRYHEISQRVFAILARFTPLVEPVSVDEAFLDVTASVPLFGPAKQIARRIREEIHRTVGLTASVGVAPNKFLAKLASDLKKPDALVVLDESNIATILPPLSISRIHGIGPRTAERLADIGIRTFADLARTPLDVLKTRVGNDAEYFQQLARGEDDREVHADRDARSIGQEQTFGEDVIEPEEIRRVLLEQCEQVGERLRRHALHARCVTIKIRYGDFQTITRRTTLPHPTDATADLWREARELFDKWTRDHFVPVRLIGMTASQFGDEEGQMDLFPDPEHDRRRKLDQTLDRINQRFGKRTIHRSK